MRARYVRNLSACACIHVGVSACACIHVCVSACVCVHVGVSACAYIWLITTCRKMCICDLSDTLACRQYTHACHAFRQYTHACHAFRQYTHACHAFRLCTRIHYVYLSRSLKTHTNTHTQYGIHACIQTSNMKTKTHTAQTRMHTQHTSAHMRCSTCIRHGLIWSIWST